MTEKAKSGHVTTAASLAELFSVLFFHKSGMILDPKNAKNLNSDRLVLSGGHACQVLYAAWAESGIIPK